MPPLRDRQWQRRVRIFRWFAACATTLIGVAAIIDPTQALGWYYGWLVLWVSALPSWAVVACGYRNSELSMKMALAHDLVLVWAAVVAIPGLPNMMGVLILWFLVFFYLEAAILLVAHVRSISRPSSR